MPKNLKLKTTLWVIGILLALYLLLPTMGGKMPSLWSNFMVSDRIRLGLDLLGGMHLVLEVEVDKAVEAQVERISQELRRKMQSEKIRAIRPQAEKGGLIKVTLLAKNDQAKFEDMVQSGYPDFKLEPPRDLPDGKIEFTLKLTAAAAKRIKEMASAQALEKIRNRVDLVGVAEPDIVPQEDGRILVQLPDVKDPERAKALIGKTAQLDLQVGGRLG